jgi:hypothetical protein
MNSSDKNNEQDEEALLPSSQLQEQQTNALKILNSKLLSQIHQERQKTEVSPSTPQLPTTAKKKKKKGALNRNPNPNVATATDDQNAETVLDPTVQDFLVQLQIENKTLASNLAILEEEVCPFPNRSSPSAGLSVKS